MSKRKSGRDIHGIILLDKRLGVSSNKALQEVRRLLNANKAGHTGSLDPLATGLLPLCFGEATKVSALMLDDNKRYQVVVQLGVTTDSGDVEGAIIDRKPVPDLTPEQIETCLQQFRGDIDQIPPMYSALKHQGKKLYELAREGITIDREPRRITIFELTLLNATADQLTLDVFCSKGTYIRSLAMDIGDYFGCGATVATLRRTSAGQFDLNQAYTWEQLQQMDEAALHACLLPVDLPLRDWPRVELDEMHAAKVKHGQTITVDSAISGSVRIYSEKQFLGLGELSLNGKLAPKKLFNLDNETL